MAETASESAPSRARFPASQLSALALQTCDDADHLNEVLRAYTALEKLVAPADLQDCETLTPSRTELSALLYVLNEALTSRIATVHAAAEAMHLALQVPEPTFE